MAGKTFRAKYKFARITARKARPVMDLVRGKGVNEALTTLQFVHRRAAPMISKIIRSALANAGQDLDVDVNHLVVSDARVDDGPLLGGRYRWRPRAMGRVYPIRKRTSHISVILEEVEAPAPKIRAKPEAEEPVVDTAAPEAPEEATEPKAADVEVAEDVKPDAADAAEGAESDEDKE